MRVDLILDSELTRETGESAIKEKTITRDSVEPLESSGRGREEGHTTPFGEWARREHAAIGASDIVSIIEDRLDKSVKGIGSGVRDLIFDPVITVDHTVTRVGTAR